MNFNHFDPIADTGLIPLPLEASAVDRTRLLYQIINKHYLLIIGLLLSTLVHYWYLDSTWRQKSASQRPQTDAYFSPFIQVIVDGKNSAPQKSNAATDRDLSESLATSEQFSTLPDKAAEPPETSISSPSQPLVQAELPSDTGTINNTQTVTRDPELSAKTGEQNITLGSIYAQAREHATSMAITPDELYQTSVIFDPKLKTQLNEQLRQQRRSRAAGNLGQLAEQNEHTEFATQGNVQVVRVNGRCFQKVKDTSLSVDSYNWLIMGGCEVSEKLDFKTSKLDREYRAN
jgi:hypothetical protein